MTVENNSSSGGISRRRFLQILGSGAAAGVAGCADSPHQNIFPMARGSDEAIPGVSVWYNTTCQECSAGCGIQVRTREGRAVKIEGNPDHPVNRGGVCAMGHSALQNLYDPDRVRQPLSRDSDGMTPSFNPISWDAGIAKFGASLKANSGKQVLVTRELSGAMAELVKGWCDEFGVEQITYELLSQRAVAEASSLVYGTYGIPTFDLSKADVLVNFGADFLETWLSPCEFARDWSASRKSDRPIRTVQIEPRLSLTGANADLWLRPKVGTEVLLARAVLKALLDRGAGKDGTLESGLRDKVLRTIANISIDEAAEVCGVSKERILLIVDYLGSADSSLVLAGGVSAASGDAIALHVVVNLINRVLGNVGKTVRVTELLKPRSSASAVQSMVDRLQKGEIKAVYFLDTDPCFSLPSSFGLTYALKKADLVVSLATHLNETSVRSDLTLPIHTSLEAWGDSELRPGVLNLSQPTMTPIFDTKQAGDILMAAAKSAGGGSSSRGTDTFEVFLQERWKKIHQGSGSKDDFRTFWTAAVERGGLRDAKKNDSASLGKVNDAVFGFSYDRPEFARNGAIGDIVLVPYTSVRSFDGRAANRPWLQELPDPITQIVWDSWAEIHPETARKLGVAQGDVLTIRNDLGEINVSAYVSEYVEPGIVAVPIGQGHANLGRYAKSVTGGNVLTLLPAKVAVQTDVVPLVSTRVSVTRSRSTNTLVNVQGSDSQLGRELARTTLVSAGAAAALQENEAHAESHEAHEEEKQMYEQREHPLYKWGLAVDLAACTGCSACVVACNSENNIPFVGKQVVGQGREMSWLRIERYYDGSAEELQVSFLPMMCQHCQNAPCEPVCPVYATYHNEEGLNSMVYNRCVGTRYCSNNCSYKVRRFNWFEYDVPETLSWQLNPDVTKRTAGVMEKCTFCVQRIAEAKDKAKDLGRMVEDGEVKPACVQSCPSEALVFGNLNDPKSKVSTLGRNTRAYKVLDHHINTQPSVVYLEDKRLKV